VTTTFRLREVMEAQPTPPSVAGLAERAGVSRTTVHAIYHNSTARVDLATLDALAGALGCEPGELIGRAKRGKG
jgi:DNA-binding Xre family transcriptional regulator